MLGRCIFLVISCFLLGLPLAVNGLLHQWNSNATVATNATVIRRSLQGREIVVPKLSAVLLTIAKDAAVFKRSINSALKHLVDVDKFYVVTPNKVDLSVRFQDLVAGERVIFVDEAKFNFSGELVADIMWKTVKEKGVYPLSEKGNSPFEGTLWGKLGWHLQQLIKVYAGKVLDLEDYVLLDGDCVWFKDVNFIAEEQTSSSPPFRYNYATSTQYHGPYVASSARISGVPTYHDKDGWRSGVVHHMVLVKPVLNSLFEAAESLHALPMWQVMLNQSALEMTCRAPRAPVCGAGSTLSEYEMYFSYARTKFPETVKLRPLLWANGPMPGTIYWPDPNDPIPILSSDSPKHKWLPNRHSKDEELQILERQMAADAIAGFDFIGYHGYAKRRYFELPRTDIETLCGDSKAPFNTTCSYRGLDTLELRPDRTPQDWFVDCGCYMAKSAGGL